MLDRIRQATETATANKDLVSYIKKEFYIPETKNDPVYQGKIQLIKYQEDCLREALRRDENGNFVYSIIIWSDIKKSGKSTIAAAVNYARAKHTEWGEFYIVANDIKQANSRVAKYLRRSIQLNPKDRHNVRTPGYTIIFPNQAIAEAIPIDPTGEAGSNNDMVTFSELWGAYEDAKQNMWAEMTIPPTKYGQAFRWVESYAGFLGESELLHNLYELGTKEEMGARLIWPDRLYDVTDGQPSVLEAYSNPSAGMFCLWNTQPRCPWQTKEYYATERKLLPVNQFNRIHRNQWVSSTETFVPMEWFDACKRTDEEWPQWEVLEKDKKTPVMPFTKDKWPMVIALDAAVSDDTFAIWMGCRHPQNMLEVMTIYVQVWYPPMNGKIDFQGTDEFPGPEKMIRRLIKDYNVVQITYDPTQLHDMATRLRNEGLGWFQEFNQGTDRLVADSQLRKLIRDKRLWHRGERDFREHVQNADAKIDEQDRKIRIVHRTEKGKIDAAVAASMGSHQVLYLILE